MPIDHRFELRTNATNRRIREIITAVKNKTLIPRPDFQRRLVWTNRDRLAFLDTILNGIPFPEIYVCAGNVDPTTAQGTEWLVDGQQRVSTIVAYFDGDPLLRLPSGMQPYNDLAHDDKHRFLEYTVVVRDLGAVPIEYVKDVFKRINSTKYGLNAMELANARYDGAIKKLAEKLAGSDFYDRHGIFSASDIRRMADVSFQLSVLITMEMGYFDDTDEHEAYLEKYNEAYPGGGKYAKRLESVFALIDDIGLPSDCRWWKKADVFSLVVELDAAMHNDGARFDGDALLAVLVGFENELQRYGRHDQTLDTATRERASKYSQAAAQGSNHRKNRITRGEILAEVLAQVAV